MAKIDKRWVLAGLVLIAAVGGYAAWKRFNEPGLPSGIASGNGRIEATEIDISALSAGRLDKLLVAEGDLIQHGQVLARMDIVQLEA